ncbi:GET complex subunit get1 [Physocladia obscura]|uniref:GET complex subunit get1 n=1 Tax=Physocladia obscura TaxID=109957 RepID=A0AAD5X9I2_9FUNG|nr:GET complex subunit get1 [Physocladia obscura]
MTTVLIAIFILAAALALLDGNHSTIGTWLFGILRAIIPSARSAQIAKLKIDLIDAKRSLNAISAQDEFAKWAKERRKHDKIDSEYATLVKSQTSEKATFVSNVSWSLWGVGWIIQLAVIFVYLRTPMFYVPHSFVGPFARMLAAPFAPKGSVSVSFWLFSSKSFIKKTVSLFKPSLIVQTAISGAVKTDGTKLVKVE